MHELKATNYIRSTKLGDKLNLLETNFIAASRMLIFNSQRENKMLNTVTGDDGTETSEARAFDLVVRPLRNRLSIIFSIIF